MTDEDLTLRMSALVGEAVDEVMGEWKTVEHAVTEVDTTQVEEQTAAHMARLMEPIYEMHRVVQEQERQAEQRKRYPALQSAWEQYLFVLRMVDNEPNLEE